MALPLSQESERIVLGAISYLCVCTGRNEFSCVPLPLRSEVGHKRKNRSPPADIGPGRTTRTRSFSAVPGPSFEAATTRTRLMPAVNRNPGFELRVGRTARARNGHIAIVAHRPPGFAI